MAIFVTFCCYAMNNSVSTSSAFSLYELVFLKPLSDILKLCFTPIQQVALGYKKY